MIRSNLSVLLAERSLRITTVARDTGISRTTLTSLASNSSAGVQFDTINTLCNYLRVFPSDLLQYIPYEVSFEVEGNVVPDIWSLEKVSREYPEAASHFTLWLSFKGHSGTQDYSLSCSAYNRREERGSDVTYFSGVQATYEEESGYAEVTAARNNKGLADLMKVIPVAFQEELSRSAYTAIGKFLQANGVNAEEGFWDFHWPFARFVFE